jgi:hypothetical protein
MAKTFGELGLRPREWDVIKACLHARDATPTGYCLCSPAQVASVRRLIERGLVTDVTKEAALGPRFPGWVVVMIGQANIEAMDQA